MERRDGLVKEAGRGIEGERVAFLIENSYDYVGALISISIPNSKRT